MDQKIILTQEELEGIRKNVCFWCGGCGVIDTRHQRLGLGKRDYAWMVCFSCHGSGARPLEKEVDSDA